jgi:hypothetical protein
MTTTSSKTKLRHDLSYYANLINTLIDRDNLLADKVLPLNASTPPQEFSEYTPNDVFLL